MPILKNPRHDHFAELVAAGETPTKAYGLAFKPGPGAPTSAGRLMKKADVKLRIAELRSAAAERHIEKAALSKAWVLDTLMENVRQAMNPTRESDRVDRGAANQALRLLGLELGMFREASDHTLRWDGDLSKLSASELANLQRSLEQIAFANDPAGLEDWRRGEPAIDALAAGKGKAQ